jgi:uridine kinase
MYLIGIAGPSGSGKTELARALAESLGAPILSLDSYYRELAHLTFEERARTNFDVPEAIEHDLLVGHLRTLAGGGAVEVPVYDFTRHSRTGRAEALRASEFGVLEGLWALYWEDIRRLLGTKVYVDTPDEVCFERRLARDLRERGRSAESVVAQYAATTRPMALRYVLPSREFADVVVSGIEPVARSAAALRAEVLARAAKRDWQGPNRS